MTENDRSRPSRPPPPAKEDKSWTDSIPRGIREHFSVPHNWLAPVAAAGLTLGLWTFYQSYLRRFPGTDHIAHSFFRRRSLFGTVTSVGDGDGFHMFHTPGGRLAGWGWLRRVPKDRKELKDRTISVRIAGIDAPEGAHFGKPAQPFAAEAQAFLESYVLHRRVRAYIYRRDQYERVVATVYVRRPPFFFPRRDVGLEMLRRGLATTYEGKTGAEFGGPKMEALYKATEAAARKKGRGMWSAEKQPLFFFGMGKRHEEPVETPMAFKRRMKSLDEEKGKG
ncbi:3f5148ca-e4a1-4aa6-9f67-d20ee7ecbd77 [Thermothielavioides terrestris]|uniref:Probable endonuclease LCL3 n=1 Tax=Thermothielavioides terrestris TaxID=2587410 RepID=A0A3S4EUG3_9PEZI|nr:3f5148ca-e4a1-4aa6-9f67-d20ee7ecbd77 [Thermothielavioides terrestris]